MPFINGIGPGELIIILIIALIVVGPGKLPDVGSALGKSIREFRKAATDVKESVSLDPLPTPSASAPTTPAPTTPAPTTPAPPAPPAPAVPPALSPAPVVPAAPPVVPEAAAVAAAAPLAAAPIPAAPPIPATPPAASQPAEPAEWPAEVTPVDDQRPTASA